MAIISFQHNFIFIKTSKTAGTSIEVDLSPVAGDDAIVTPIIPAEPGHAPRNYLGPDETLLFYNHMPAIRIRELLGEARFASMFKFCIEREPIEKCISHYHMLRNSNVHNPDGTYQNSWDDYVQAGRFPIDIGKYTDPADGGQRQMIVDKVLRYDALPQALPRILSAQGVTGFSLRAQAKSGYSHNRHITPDSVTPAQRTIIYDAFRETLDLTGIDWDQAPDLT